MPPSRTKERILFAGILLAGFALRLIYLSEISSYPNFELPFAGIDEAMNHDLARQVASGDLMLGHDIYFFSSPLYVYILGGFYALFGASVWTARLLNIAFGLGSVALLYCIGRKIFRSEWVALFSSACAAVYGPFVFFDTSIYKTSFTSFLLLLSVLLIARASTRNGGISWIFPGIILGLTAAVQGQAVLLIGLICLYLLAAPSSVLIPDREADRILLADRGRTIALLLAGAFTALLPFGIRNYLAAHEAVMVHSLGGIHLYVGNHKGAYGGYSIVDGVRPNPAGHFYDARRIAERELGRRLSSREVSRYWGKKAFEFARGEKTEFFRLIREKIRLLFSFFELNDYDYFRSRSPLLGMLPGIGLFLPVCMAGLFLSVSEHRRFWALHALILTTAFGMIITFVTWRYRIPLIFALLPFAAYGIAQAADHLRQRRPVVPALFLSFIAMFWVLGEDHPIRKIRLERDILKNSLQMDAAAEELEIRRKIMSDSSLTKRQKSDLLLKIALIRYRVGDTEGGIGILEQALVTDPDNATVEKTLMLMLASLSNVTAAGSR